MKKCNQCERQKNEIEFSAHKGRTDGLQEICKLCAKFNARKYYQQNKDKHKATVRKYYNTHKPEPYKSKICGKCLQDKDREKFKGRNNSCKVCDDCKSIKKVEPPKSSIKICPSCDKTHSHKKENVCRSCVGVYKRYKQKIYMVNHMGGKCFRCGLPDIECLDFHHTNPKTKTFEFSQVWGVAKLEDLIDEASKCELLCVHCHRKEHSKFQQRIIDYFERDIDNTKKRPSTKPYKPLPHKRKYERPSKEELHKLVWEKPTCELAKQLGVSDKCIEKWCSCYEIDKPPRGYWAKQKSKWVQDTAA